MTGPAELYRARWYSLGAVMGLLVGGLLVASWHQSSEGLSVTVLGAGRQASVLITSSHRRVLIAAGSNGAAFSNAVSAALPPMLSSRPALISAIGRTGVGLNGGA